MSSLVLSHSGARRGSLARIAALAWLLGAGACVAGPVDADSASATATSDAASSAANDAMLEAVSRLNAAAGGQDAAAATPRREARAAAGRVATPASGSARGKAAEGEGFAGWWRSVRQAMPWNDDPPDDGLGADRPADRLGTDLQGQGHGVRASSRSGGSDSKPADDARLEAAGAAYEDNPVRKAIMATRAVATHPLTWLVILLLAAARVAVSIFGRRKRHPVEARER